jgi:hypothetical protein
MLTFVVGGWWRITIAKSTAHHELINLEGTEIKCSKYFTESVLATAKSKTVK